MSAEKNPYPKGSKGYQAWEDGTCPPGGYYWVDEKYRPPIVPICGNTIHSGGCCKQGSLDSIILSYEMKDWLVNEFEKYKKVLREKVSDHLSCDPIEAYPNLDDKKEFKSGATSTTKKPWYHLIPVGALKRLAARFEYGAKKHGDYNYRKGAWDQTFIKDRINHMIEHSVKYAQGDNTTDHLGAILCNAAILADLEEIQGKNANSD